MLERRVSNNRSDLNGDQQMNYFLAWFNTWSEIQREDFVKVLAGKMSTNGAAVPAAVNGLANAFKSMDCNSDRPPSLFSCQVKLFHDWFAGWSDDQKNYLTMRLKDIDADFFASYETYLQDPDAYDRSKKDYFEPGIPDELIRKPSSVAAPPGPGGDSAHNGRADFGDEEEEEEDSLKKVPVTGGPSPLSPISENA